MTPSQKMVLRQRESEPGVAYLELMAHPHSLVPGIVANGVFLHWLIDYQGPKLNIDFDKDGEAIGIEILYSCEEEESGKKMVLRQCDSDPGVAYLELHAHPHALEPGIVSNTVSLHDLIEDYNGPLLNLDFNKDGEAIGIEILDLGENGETKTKRKTKRCQEPKR